MQAKRYKDPLAEGERRIEEAKRFGYTELDLSGLGLTAIPDSVAQLTNLQTLSLHTNRITTIPNSVAKLANLERLFLHHNQITTIPDSLAQLPNLLLLALYDNRIRVIPDALAQLTVLRILGLANNQVSAIPDSLAQLHYLRHLGLWGNPDLGIPDEILQSLASEPKEILNYYFASRSTSKPLNEGKLILVGRGGVGKTSLVKALTTGKFEPGTGPTEGIKIDDWSCELAPEDTVTVHVWDFGGQEMMHATHQFFLTARSLYLLVLNRRQDDSNEEIEYWLRLIRAFGGKDAPVIVVLNKQEEQSFDVNRAGWLEKYPDNIKGFVETDCEHSKSIAKLAESIRQQLKEMKSLKATFPTRWFAIKEKLAGMQTDYVTFDQYRAICRDLGEPDPEQQTSLSGYLHDLGIALNYKDDPRLRFAYVLKPGWVTEGIYALLHSFVEAKGLFSPNEAEKVLEKKGYSVEAVHFILGLMEQFELSFPLGDARKRILIPQLLDDQQSPEASSFRLAECLNFGYRYPIIPAGLLPRFIVRTHHLSEVAERWKSGVILRDARSGCRAPVRGDAAERQVRIHIDGPDDSRRELLAIIRHNFDVIHSDYEFKPDDLVYPPGAPGKPLSLDELQTLQSAGILTQPVVLPNKTIINPKIGDLLDSVDTPKATLKIFLSYAHEDEKAIDELRKSLKVMERNGLLRSWYDRELTAGEKWDARIEQELNDADVIVLQLSRDFLASQYCVEKELAIAIQRKEKGEAELIAYVLRACDWEHVPDLKKFQILPPGTRPINKWNSHEYWVAVADGIRKALETLQSTQRTNVRQSALDYEGPQ